MTDSEPDMLPNNIFAYQNGSTIYNAKGPNISRNFRSNMTSKMNMPWNMDQPRYAESAYDQRSICHRRETSPMSLHSLTGRQPRNFHNSYYNGRAESLRGTFNGRSGSPTMSTRTMDSNASVTAIDIAAALKTQKFNKYDLRMIKDAYNKFLKHRLRKRVEKRRNLRLFLKGMRRRSGDDSGEQGSDSSISSDDCRSTRTSRTTYRDKTSSCRSTRTDLADFRKTMTESNMYKDCTDNFRQNSLRNMFSVEPRSVKENTLKSQNVLHNNMSVVSQKERFRNGFQLPSQRFNQSIAALPIPEKENRWQRPNINGNKRNLENENKRQEKEMSHETESEQEEIFSEITVTEKSMLNGSKMQCKRSLEAGDDILTSNNKRNKLSLPQTRKPASTLSLPKQAYTNDFEFVKPQFPLKKTVNAGKVVVKSQLAKNFTSNSAQQSGETIISSTNQQSGEKIISSSKQQSAQQSGEKIISSSNQQSAEKSILKSGPKSAVKSTSKSVETITERTVQKSTQQPKEKLVVNSVQEEIVISKSSQPLDGLEPQTAAEHNIIATNQEKENEETNQLSTTDMSMRPSFIKRKLFTQKVDAESKNSSSDNLGDSPQTNIYSAIQKEKNKTRKLTTQSCLSRDILGDDSNLLDLIHKIVPKDRMNTTNAVNKTDNSNKSKPADAENKWDVTSVISMCNKDDVSETYTDEEIFKIDEQNITTAKKRIAKSTTPKQKVIKKCKVIVQNISLNNKIANQAADKSLSPEIVNTAKTIISPTEDNGMKRSNLYNCVKSFWDTDVESDIDCGRATPWKSNLRYNHITGINSSIDNNAPTTSIRTNKQDKIMHAPQLPSSKTRVTKSAVNGKGKNQQATPSESSKVSPQKTKDRPQLPTSKTKLTKSADHGTGKNQNQKVTSSESSKVSPQETKNKPQLPTSKTKLTKSADHGKGKKQNQKVTSSESSKVSPQETKNKPQLPTLKTKLTKSDHGTGKIQKVTPSESHDVSPQETNHKPKQVTTTNLKDSNKNTNSKKNPSENSTSIISKKNEVTLKTVKTKQPDNASKDPDENKNEVTPKTVKAKNTENIKTVSSQKNEVAKKPKTNPKNNGTTKSREEKIKVTNNNTLKERPQTEESKQNKPLIESNETVNRSLRSRVIDLSTSLVSATTNPSNKPAPQRGRHSKIKNVTKNFNVDNSRSDISFSLTDKTSPNKPNKRKTALIKNNRNAEQKARRSDVSFTLISDKTSLNKTTGDCKRSSRTRNSSKIGNREIESLQMSTSFFLRSCKKSSNSRKYPCC